MTNLILSMSLQRAIRVKHLADWLTQISSIWRQVSESKELKIKNKNDFIIFKVIAVCEQKILSIYLMRLIDNLIE
jgi:hypothetical protein